MRSILTIIGVLFLSSFLTPVFFNWNIFFIFNSFLFFVGFIALIYRYTEDINRAEDFIEQVTQDTEKTIDILKKWTNQGFMYSESMLKVLNFIRSYTDRLENYKKGI